MLKRIAIIATIALSVSISSQVSAQTVTKKKTTKVSTAKSDVVQGGLLISKADCLSCHKPTIKLIGPSFKEIAQKYKPTDKNYAMLVEKVIKGGSGNWGPMAMSPHGDIAPANVKKMITYILATK
ncbi:cytochrome c [Pedobacter sp. UYP30]|uniref:c-type cytochrome n=1 Tax=Pedobacter sp. UYP30 TaxID=1756400 RepID=UPI003397CD2E